MIRPSSLPMLAACPCWESSGGNDDTNAGTQRHIAFARALSNDPEPFRDLRKDDHDSVEWAAEYVRMHAPTSDHEMRLEFHLNPLDTEFHPIFENGGTADALCGPHLFDLKTRERDYNAQMAAYALAMFQEHGWDQVHVHLLFTETKRPVKFTFTETEAADVVNRIVAAVKEPNRQPTACDYCGWCSKVLNCPAHLSNAVKIARERQELSMQAKVAFEAWVGQGAHTSAIEDPALMGEVLRVARVLANWCDAAEFRAKDMAIKEGKIPSGFKLQSRQGNRFVASVADAFPLVGLPQAEFLKACECKPTLLFETYAGFHGLKKPAAEREVERKLGEVLQRKASTQSLVVEKQ